MNDPAGAYYSMKKKKEKKNLDERKLNSSNSKAQVLKTQYKLSYIAL
jgi:hypothetical protein